MNIQSAGVDMMTKRREKVSNLFAKRMDLAIALTQANMMDELDARNKKGYWEGYFDALVEIRNKIEVRNETII